MTQMTQVTKVLAPIKDASFASLASLFLKKFLTFSSLIYAVKIFAYGQGKEKENVGVISLLPQ